MELEVIHEVQLFLLPRTSLIYYVSAAFKYKFDGTFAAVLSVLLTQKNKVPNKIKFDFFSSVLITQILNRANNYD